jgi:hypothetical protein
MCTSVRSHSESQQDWSCLLCALLISITAMPSLLMIRKLLGRYKKKDLDLTLPFRLANLPNGAAAELVELPLNEAAARMVSVALQREGEPRIQTEVSCASSLWEMLERLEVQCGSSLVTGLASSGKVFNF